ncbi:2,3-bisphosphoglycerate-dependent phosphoglycerate mutase [Gracilibacillus ureilyticus]|uniref:2,3-bisphosphoglycerate-dependent phosphoglycerate mutase n=1 Tax=Gracilibacillus ureilyticus TaxID=531814 RepID=A0A1H9LKF6_9BACI|nr:histidine phosphatase family protein [Gracilibacillus ureilyticus]SER11585.1 2,3-bisphosphoglycerate-dependent phosphoglycerate mutase [Gracilibacillus ureilyticus]
MKRILLIRHCDATGQHKDSPLSKEGNVQAYELAKVVKQLSFPVDRIISSPYLRAKETIRPLASELEIEIEIDDRLKERTLSDEPIDDWFEILEESFHNYQFKLPGGESSKEAFNRANTVLEECLSNDQYDSTIIVTHGNLLALMLEKFQVDFGFHGWKALTNPDIFLVQRVGGEEVIERIWE